MAASAANAPLAVEVLATQKLYYNTTINPLIGMFLIFSSQCLGYGIAGLLRPTLVYPTKMLYPSNLPINTLIETLHGDKLQVVKRLKVFYWGFAALFVWEVMPQYIMPFLTGVSVFCLAQQNNMTFTRIFGGSNGNEGLGVLSLCFDFQYITSASMWLPLQTLVNNFVGYILCVIAFVAVYYGNNWRSQDFPFLSQLLFSPNSTHEHYKTYNQSLILNAQMEVDPALVAEQGLPYFTGTFIVYIMTTNLAITATFVHMFLWNYDDIKTGWSFASPAKLKRAVNPKNWMFWKSTGGEIREEIDDPHYKLMLAYKDTPNVGRPTNIVFTNSINMLISCAVVVWSHSRCLNHPRPYLDPNGTIDTAVVGLPRCLRSCLHLHPLFRRSVCHHRLHLRYSTSHPDDRRLSAPRFPNLEHVLCSLRLQQCKSG